MEPILFRYRGRDLCAVDIALVRATIAAHYAPEDKDILTFVYLLLKVHGRVVEGASASSLEAVM